MKTVYTGDVESFRKSTSRVPCSDSCCGWGTHEDTTLRYSSSEGSIKAGSAGLSFGRNVFQHKNPEAMSKALGNSA